MKKKAGSFIALLIHMIFMLKISELNKTTQSFRKSIRIDL